MQIRHSSAPRLSVLVTLAALILAGCVEPDPAPPTRGEEPASPSAPERGSSGGDAPGESRFATDRDAPALPPGADDPACLHWMHMGMPRPGHCPIRGSSPVVVAQIPPPFRCDPSRQTVRQYAVVAFFQDITYNKFGDHDPIGMMYALESDRAAIEEGTKRPRPLVLRANAGDCVEVRFTNDLRGGGTQGIPTNPRAGMHFHGLSYDVRESDGAAVGLNPDTLASVGQSITYRLLADREGVWQFHDHGTEAGGEGDGGSNTHGLFGAFVVEPRGSRWLSSVTGLPTVTDLQADIIVPGSSGSSGNDFREFVIIFHDETEILTADGEDPVHPVTGQPDSTQSVNYGSEPGRNRHAGCPECIGEETSLSSWPYGDPALLAQFEDDPSNVFRAYVGDNVRIRLVHGGVFETHVFHWHVHQWRAEPNDPDSTIIDSQSISPGEAFTIVPLFGAGSRPGAPGDAIFHCHLYPHFAQGMWGLVRVLDRLEDGSRRYPDGTRIPRLGELVDRAGRTPAPTPAQPGFPHFIPGTSGHRGPQPPFTVTDSSGAVVRDDGLGNNLPPTALERSALRAKRPGAPMVDPCPLGSRVVTYEIVAIQLNMTYNQAGWHDTQARILVPKSQEADILAGRIKPEPLVMRANAGDCVVVRLTNHLPLFYGGDVFRALQRTNLVGEHVHLVKFDPLGSDGSANGWNYVTGAFQNQTIEERWFCDVELRTVFTHDHFFPNVHQQSGLFGALVTEPRGARYRDPVTGAIDPPGRAFGVRKDILLTGGGNDFREYVGFVQDFVPQFLPDGRPLNPPAFPDSPDDPGVMAFNYRNEPRAIRAGGDPAHYFSSWLHGDPSTPVFEAYAGDPVRFRVLQGAHEEQHGFVVNGLRWRQEPGDRESPLIAEQTIGISEAFNFEIPNRLPINLPRRVFSGDHLYGVPADDDLTLGVWGILRAFDARVPGLLPLPDRAPPRAGGVRATPTFAAPPPAVDPGNPCPGPAPVHRFDVVAIGPLNVTYNRFGDHDPHALAFALARDEAAIRSGAKALAPLTLRARAGECIVVNLTNKLPATLPRHEGDAASGTGGAELPTRTGPGLRCGCQNSPNPAINGRQEPIFPDPAPGSRVGLSPQLVRYDVRGSDGTAVGFNPDQTVAPGRNVTYRWFADLELGAANLLSYGDYRNHRHHGLFAGLVVEPALARITDPVTGAPTDEGVAVDVDAIRGAFRDFALYYMDGLNLRDVRGRIIPDVRGGSCPLPGDGAPSEGDEVTDAEDSGEKGFNYRSEPFCNRLRLNPDRSRVMSSVVHGDPATPVFLAHVGDAYRFRVLMGADQPRNHAFTLHDAVWPRQPNDAQTNLIATQGQITVGSALNVQPLDPAGGRFGVPGDYAYRDMVHVGHLSGGLWGILRVLSADEPGTIRQMAEARGGEPES